MEMVQNEKVALLCESATFAKNVVFCVVRFSLILQDGMMRPCPIPGCHGRRKGERVMCLSCWSNLDPETQREICVRWRRRLIDADYFRLVRDAQEQAQAFLYVRQAG